MQDGEAEQLPAPFLKYHSPSVQSLHETSVLVLEVSFKSIIYHTLSFFLWTMHINQNICKCASISSWLILNCSPFARCFETNRDNKYP